MSDVNWCWFSISFKFNIHFFSFSDRKKKKTFWLAGIFNGGFLWHSQCTLCTVRKRFRFMSVRVMLPFVLPISFSLHSEYFFGLHQWIVSFMVVASSAPHYKKIKKIEKKWKRNPTFPEASQPAACGAEICAMNEQTIRINRRIDICVFHPTAIRAPW